MSMIVSTVPSIDITTSSELIDKSGLINSVTYKFLNKIRNVGLIDISYL